MVFGLMALYLKVDKTPKRGRKPSDQSNAKMKREDSQFSHFVEAYVLPLQTVLDAIKEPFNAKGGYDKQAALELLACAAECPHRHDNLGYTPNIGMKQPPKAVKCYVDLLHQIKPAINGAAKALETGSSSALEVNNFELRLTAWGDIARLNDEGLAYVKLLQDLAGDHLSYSAGVLWDDRIEVRGQASVTTLTEALKADSDGLKVYMSGSEEDKQAFRLAASSPVYRCPVSKPREQDMGCTTCPIRCNGARHVLSP